jgi:GNAT superfamily N-acetyltransferase
MAFTCREAVAADHGRVVELLAAQLGEHSLAPARTALEAAAAALIGEPRLGRIFVAEIGGRIVGLAAMSWSFSLEHGGRAAWLDELYVVPDERGRGVGAALLEAARAAATAGGALAMDLEIEAGHERVASLYERHGFSRHRRQRWFLRL